MDRRRILFALTSATLSTAASQLPETAIAQGARMRGAEYLGAISVLRRTIDWVEVEVRRLLDDRDETDEGWRVDVLAPFAAVAAVQEASLALLPPTKYDDVHALWRDALDELAAAERQLRIAVLDDVARAYSLADRALDRARDLLDEVDAALPGRVAQLTQTVA
jgi:hypothetical protein